MEGVFNRASALLALPLGSRAVCTVFLAFTLVGLALTLVPTHFHLFSMPVYLLILTHM
jgi:hypothetical protein